MSAVHLQEKKDKLIAGHVEEKKGYLYWVLNVVVDGKRKPKWIPTGRKAKGNKTWANNELPRVRREWTEKLKAESETANPGTMEQGDSQPIRTIQPSSESSLDTPDPGDMDFVDFLYQWLDYKYKTATAASLDKNIELTTYAGYEGNVKSPIEPYFREHPVTLNGLSKEMIEEFYQKQLERVAVTTVKHYHSAIHCALNYAVDKKILKANPADRIIFPKLEKFKGDFYVDSEVLELFEILKGHKMELIVLLTAFYGLRRSEVLGLKWSAFDFSHDCFSIRHTVTTCRAKGEKVVVKKDRAKNKSSRRTYPLIPFIKERLLEAKKQQDENKRLCGRSYNKENIGYICVDAVGDLIKPNYVSCTFPKLLAKNNLRHIRFHDLRHTCASLLLANGIPMEQVKEWLGHSEISTTVDIYGHLQFATKRNSAAAMERDIVQPFMQMQSPETGTDEKVVS